MANQTLTLTINTTTGFVRASGLTDVMPHAVKKILTQNGVCFEDGDNFVGRLTDRRAWTSKKMGLVKAALDSVFDSDPNPYHATDNLTIVFDGS